MRLRKGVRMGIRLASRAARRGMKMTKHLAAGKNIDRKAAQKLIAEARHAARAVSRMAEAAAQRQISRLDPRTKRDARELQKHMRLLRRQLRTTAAIGARIAKRMMR
ncbi:MAG TPA: hypothetical protein VJC16_03010 [Candidatus Nanoarchaeia archaeon]|nr:hypothetical protein [Candidatus Nanoarchaeia archaeon]